MLIVLVLVLVAKVAGSNRNLWWCALRSVRREGALTDTTPGKHFLGWAPRAFRNRFLDSFRALPPPRHALPLPRRACSCRSAQHRRLPNTISGGFSGGERGGPRTSITICSA